MKTVVVWVLLIIQQGPYNNSGGPAVLDNIASEKSCHLAASQVSAIQNGHGIQTRCIPVAKVIP